MQLTFKAMSVEDAKVVIGWRYPDAYSMYNIDTDDIDKEAVYLADPNNHYYAIYAQDDLVGHAVFHAEARVPGGDYGDDMLDIGAGMRPDWTGQGKGAHIIARILDFGHERYGASAFRATIAAWNIRAQKATIKTGFEEVSRFRATSSGKGFIIFVKRA